MCLLESVLMMLYQFGAWHPNSTTCLHVTIIYLVAIVMLLYNVMYTYRLDVYNALVCVSLLHLCDLVVYDSNTQWT